MLTPDDARTLQALLTERRVLTIGLLTEGQLTLGLMPFAIARDGAHLLVHGSRLAKHTRGLEHGATASVLIHQDDTPETDPLQLPRLTLQVEIAVLERESAAYLEGQSAYLARFPTGAVTFTLGDFQLFSLTPTRGRLVAGFGRAYEVGPAELRAGRG